MLVWCHAPAPRPGPFLLLDRDGVINRDRQDYVKDCSEYRFYPDALEALAWLRRKDVNVILISNQSGLDRGIIRWQDFAELRAHMLRQIRRHGGDILAEFYCPHRPEVGCACRKPRPGMLRAAAQMFAIPLSRSCFIGDRETDMEAARNAGCSGFQLQRETSMQQHASGCSDNLFQAVRDWLGRQPPA